MTARSMFFHVLVMVASLVHLVQGQTQAIYNPKATTAGFMYTFAGNVSRYCTPALGGAYASTSCYNGIPTAAQCGDGGSATMAYMNNPRSVAVDSSNNVYIGDAYGRVRLVNRQTNIISTFTASAAQSMVFDASNNLYLVDMSSTVRFVNAATGIVTVVAGNGASSTGTGDGGPATSASFGYLQSVSLDVSGNMYLTDNGDSRVRFVRKSTGIITTFAGTSGQSGTAGDGGPATSALLSFPNAAVVDASGNVFISNTGTTSYTGRIRVVAPNGIISLYAGGAPVAFSSTGGPGDGGPATSAYTSQPWGLYVDSIGNLFFADNGASLIRKVTKSTGIISTIAGNAFYGSTGDGGPATNANLGYPRGLSFDSSGNLFIADFGNNKVRIVPSASAQPLTAAPTAAPQSAAPTVASSSAAPSAVSVVQVQATQKLTGSITASTFTGMAQITFVAAVAAVAGVPTSAIAINSASRRLRRSLLDTTVTYTITTTNAVTSSSALTSALSSSLSASALAAAMTTYGVTSVAAATVTNQSPTAAPVKSAAAGGPRASVTSAVVATVLAVAAAAFLAAY